MRTAAWRKWPSLKSWWETKPRSKSLRPKKRRPRCGSFVAAVGRHAEGEDRVVFARTPVLTETNRQRIAGSRRPADRATVVTAHYTTNLRGDELCARAALQMVVNGSHAEDLFRQRRLALIRVFARTSARRSAAGRKPWPRLWPRWLIRAFSSRTPLSRNTQFFVLRHRD